MIKRLALILFVCLTTGCASLRERMAPGKAPAEQRIERKEAVLESFDAQRTQAQYEAALERANGGDLKSCEEMLRAILARKSDFVDARLKLAELLWVAGDLHAAELELRAAVASEPDRADAHHTLGILLDALDRRDESLSHLRRAAELEPTNGLFQLSLPGADRK